MRLRFQADADFNNAAVLAIRRRWPSIDLRAAKGLIAERVSDEDILVFAATEGRVLLTHDVSTMPEHFLSVIRKRESPGVILVPQQWPIKLIMEGVYLAWSQWTPEDLRNSIRWLPR